MPLVTTILKKASTYVLGSENESDEKTDDPVEDNEVLFCKNNVCVHPPTFARHELDVLHYPGYMTVASKTFIDQHTNAKRHTLLLTWIPNSALRKCPSTIEKLIPVPPSPRLAPEQLKFGSKNPFTEMINNGYTSDYSGSVSMSSSSDRIERESYLDSEEVTEKIDAKDLEEIPEDDKVKKVNEMDEEEIDKDLITELQPLLELNNRIVESFSEAVKSKITYQPVTTVSITIADPHIQNQDICGNEADLITQTSNLSCSDSLNMIEDTNSAWMTPELLAYKHNLTFPESATSSPIVQRRAMPLKCRRFSVDLSQMRSLRLFFSDNDCTSGQLVIASRESQYKILHFHHGGLDHLAQVLHQWHCLLHNIHLAPGQNEHQPAPYRHFMVCRPEVRKSELHPEEGIVNKITTDYFYGTLLNKKGQIEDDLLLRKCVFFGGLEKKLRKTVWPFLLHCYSFYSTFEDRATLLEIRRQEYEEMTKKRLYSMSPEQQAHFWKTVQCVVEKDVVRTDRGNPFFAGDDNPNIEVMKNILLNYAFYNPNLS